MADLSLLCIAFPLRKNPLEILSSLLLVSRRTSSEQYLTNLRYAPLLPQRNLLQLLPQLWTYSHPEKGTLAHPQNIAEKGKGFC